MSKLLLTAREVAEALGIGRSKVYELMNREELPSLHIDGCRRIPATAVEEYVATRLEEVA